MASVSVVLPLKIPVRNDLVRPLGNWLDSEKAASCAPQTQNPLEWVVPKPEFSSVECRSELLRLAALRNCLSENLQDGHQAAMDEHNALEDCCDYHATLLEFEKRGFPTVEHDDDGDDESSINLTWKGAFATKQQETHHSLCWDRACTLWNVAAFQSYLASLADRSVKEGCKVAISLYQAAASNLAILQELVQSQTDVDDDTPLYRAVDFSKAMLTYWEKLFLSLAQQTIYKLANLGTARQHSTLAHLIQAAAARYNDALAQAKETRLQSEVPKQSNEWSLHCKSQSLICQARAVFHLSIDHRQKQEHGMEIARLEQCVGQLKEAHAFYKSAGLEVTNELQGLIDLSRDRLGRASQDNKSIYMDDIPKDLPEIRAQHMVKENLPLAPTLMLSKVPLFEWCP
jgi:hypothetical protein